MLERIVLQNADLTVVFNKTSAEDYRLRGYPVEQMRTWYNERVYFPGSSHDRRIQSPVLTALWVGRLENPKDPLLAIEVFDALERRNSDSPQQWRYLVIGDGTLRADLQQMIAARNLQHRVKLLGACSREEVGNHMRTADALLMTSHFEGSPRVMYEAMGSALPVIATAEADPDKAIKSEVNGRISKTRDPQDLAGLFEKIDSFDRDAIVNSVHRQSASFTVSRLWNLTNGEK
ncbi:glycosyltransferase family 4 protein [Leucobacter denitrificans]|uniref:D-inositol 3-phosphate glycosyltransferase n=2 Tax=Leucobacter denitrificans TaxID=683042 RepID=A0A7G9S794_9MICO|nr:glycosyltransferase [Leucobacter denitrificans]QNN63719.1 glycosyltransferase family 4 protein [Leucobacter denitrificans]